MKVFYVKTPYWDEKMKSGLFKEKIGELHIHSLNPEIISNELKKLYRTNLNIEALKLTDLDILIWANDDEPDTLQVTFNSQYPDEILQGMIKRILESLKNLEGVVKEIKVFRGCQLDSLRVKDLLRALFIGDIVENILQNTSRLCLVDSNSWKLYFLKKSSIERYVSTEKWVYLKKSRIPMDGLAFMSEELRRTMFFYPSCKRWGPRP